jgi:GT2 family glycosyltransferase
MSLPKISLVISVYKNTKELKVILDSIKYQTVLPDEIIISEDGESLEMKTFLAEYCINVPLIHLVQEDKGWRKNIALNRAITAAKNEYLVFIDGDCVHHSKFIQNHRLLAHPNHVLAGKRIKLGIEYSNQLYQTPLPEFQKKIISEIKKIHKDGVEFYEEGIYLPLNRITKSIISKLGITSILGSNFSCYKNAIVSINGFDEDYKRPAVGEDHDLVWRFKGLGYQITSIKHFAIQYHLFHKENWTDQTENLNLYNQKVKMKNYICLNGIEKL